MEYDPKNYAIERVLQDIRTILRSKKNTREVLRMKEWFRDLMRETFTPEQQKKIAEIKRRRNENNSARF